MEWYHKDELPNTGFTVKFWISKRELRLWQLGDGFIDHVPQSEFRPLEVWGDERPHFESEQEGWDFIRNRYPQYQP